MRPRHIIVALFWSLAFCAMSLPAFAVTRGANQRIQAITITGGVRTAAFSLRLRDYWNPFGSPDRTFMTWSGVTPPLTRWQIADHVIIITSTVTDGGGGIQIYTDNADAAAAPRFGDPTPALPENFDSNPAGLLKGTVGISSHTLPMAWSIKASTQSLIAATGPITLGAADPQTGPATGVGNRFQWLFMKDRGTPNIEGVTTRFIDGENDVTMIRAHGLRVTQDSYIPHPRGQGADSYVYVEANFGSAAALQTYQTTRLTVEAFTE